MVHLRQRVDRRVYERVKSLYSVAEFLIAVLQSYRLSELLPLMPLLFCLGLLSLLPDWWALDNCITACSSSQHGGNWNARLERECMCDDDTLFGIASHKSSVFLLVPAFPGAVGNQLTASSTSSDTDQRHVL